MSAMQLYWLVKLDSIIDLFRFFSGLTLFAIITLCGFSIIMFIIETNNTEDEQKRANYARLKIKPFLIMFVILWIPLRLLRTFIPSTKEMAIIYVVPKIVNNKEIQQIPSKMIKLASDWIDELQPKSITEKVENEN